MSEDGFSDGFEEPNMEIQIKTLMGTTFDIKVSSTETVEDIKKKIYRVEGKPLNSPTPRVILYHIPVFSSIYHST